MFAVIQVGSQQFKVSEGDMIEVDRIDKAEGKEVKIDKVLLFADGKNVLVGQPYLKDVSVKAEVKGQTLADKVVAFKYRRRKNYAKKTGHRRQLTELTITAIAAK
jgi:large subunit ribosomal protein L21